MSELASWLVWPVIPYPWPASTVGARLPGASPAAGKKWATIGVPSNDLTTTSRASAAGAAHSTASTVRQGMLLREAHRKIVSGGARALAPMPELPEVEIAARRLDAAAAGGRVESAMAPGMVTMKTFEPPLDALAGATVEGVRRRGKMFVVELGELALLIHLMSAGRLQLWDERASLRDRASRLLLRLDDGRELRLREFGTQQRAWAKLLPAGGGGAGRGGGHARPRGAARRRDDLAALLDQPRHLHPLLRDQRTIAGIGRSWVDEILWTARLSPFKKGSELDRGRGRAHRRGDRDHAPGRDRPLRGRDRREGARQGCRCRLQVHRRAGEACPRCGTTIEAIHFKDYVMCYCPEEQTGGRVLKDRRLSRLLK